MGSNNATRWTYASPMDPNEIGEFDQSGRHSIDTVERSFSQASAATVPKYAVSVTALLQSLNGADGSAAKAVFVPTPGTPGNKNYRVSIGSHATTSGGAAGFFDVYRISRTRFKGTDGIRIEKVCNVTLTFLSTVPASVGPVASAVDANSAVVASTGMLEALTGRAPKSSSQDPASVEFGDLGESIGLLVCPYVGSTAPVTAMNPIVMKWT